MLSLSKVPGIFQRNNFGFRICGLVNFFFTGSIVDIQYWFQVYNIMIGQLYTLLSEILCSRK